MGHGAVREVLFAYEYVDGYRTGAHPVVVLCVAFVGLAGAGTGCGHLLLRLGSHIQLRTRTGAFVQGYAVVLPRVLRRAGTLYLHQYIPRHEVVFRPERREEIDVAVEFCTFVVRGVQLLQASGTHDAQHTFALCPQFVNVHRVALQDVVVIVHLVYLRAGHPVYGIVAELLIVGQGTGIDARDAELHVRAAALHSDAHRVCLHKAVPAAVHVRRAAHAVHIKLHQTVAAATAYHEGNLDPFAAGVVGTHACRFVDALSRVIVHNALHTAGQKAD